MVTKNSTFARLDFFDVSSKNMILLSRLLERRRKKTCLRAFGVGLSRGILACAFLATFHVNGVIMYQCSMSQHRYLPFVSIVK